MIDFYSFLMGAYTVMLIQAFLQVLDDYNML